jgi:hypothetical protein
MLIARNYDCSFHDSLYRAVAAKQQAVLINADEKLANATAAYLPVDGSSRYIIDLKTLAIHLREELTITH